MERTIAASPVAVASASALPNTLVLSRSLRPFSRRFPSRIRTEFDEEQTAEEFARHSRPIPRYRPSPERWFDVALVVEDTPSMAIWRRSLQEFRTLLERQGSFRDVRAWRLQPGGKLLDRQTVRRPAAVGDATGRRLVLIVSDCVSADWQNGAIASLALRWGRQTPVAIIQVLPPNMWVHTALGEASSTLRSPRPGLPSTGLTVDRGWWSPDPAGPSVTLPVVPLDAAEVLNWARMSMGMGGATYPGVLLDATSVQRLTESAAGQDLPSPRVMVDSYRSMVSPEAFELAGYLAAAPLSLPVMRLVQQTMFGDRARQFHLAEFFLGGLIRKVTDATDPEEATYDFHEGVRAVLVETLQRADAFEVIRRVSGFVEARMGQPLDWKALVPDAAGTAQLPEAALPFAKVAREVLGRIGSRDTTSPQPSPQSIKTLLAGHNAPVSSVVVTELDGLPVIVSASEDRTIRIWDLQSGALLNALDGPMNAVLSLDPKDPSRIFGGGSDLGPTALDLKTGSYRRLAPAKSAVTAVAAPGIWGYETGEVERYEFRNGAFILLSSSRTHRTPVNAVLELPEPNTWISASNGSVRISGRPKPYTNPDYSMIQALALVTLDGVPITILGGINGAIHLWDTAQDREVGKLLQQTPVTSLSVFQSGNTAYLVSGSSDGQLRVWNLATRLRCGAPIPTHEGGINSIAVYELKGTGWIAISGGDDAAIRITSLRRALAPHRTVMIWDITDANELSETISAALVGAGHRALKWYYRSDVMEMMASCDHVVGVTAGTVPKVLNPYHDVIQCRPFFLALGPGSEDPGIWKDATVISFQNADSREQSLTALLEAIEKAPPVRVGITRSLPSVAVWMVPDFAVKDQLKKLLLDPAGREVVYLVNPDRRECYQLAQNISLDCEIRRAFTKGIFGAYQSFPQLDAADGARALLIVTRGSLIAGATKAPLPGTRVLVTDSDYYPESASAVAIPPLNLEETITALRRSAVNTLPESTAAEVAAIHKGSRWLLNLMVGVARIMSSVAALPLQRLMSVPDPEDELIGLALQYCASTERTAAEQLMVFREDAWVPGDLLFSSGRGGSIHSLQLLGILEQNMEFPAGRLHPSARKRLPAAPSSLHADLIASYVGSGSRPLQLVHGDGYFEANIEYHLAKAGRQDLALSLVSEISWLRRKLNAVGIQRLLRDLGELHDIESVQKLNDVLGVSAALLEQQPRELAAALLRYPSEVGEPLNRLQAYATTELSSTFQAPRFFVLVAGTGLGKIIDTVSAVAEQTGKELARQGFGLITGGWAGVDEITGRAYLAERSRLGFTDSKDALIQIAGKGAVSILKEGAVIRYEEGEQEKAVERADAVILIQGLGGVFETYQFALRQNKPVFPIFGTGNDAMRAFQELVKTGRFSSEDMMGKPISSASDAARSVRGAIGKIFAASRPPLLPPVTDLAVLSLTQEYLDTRASKRSSGARTQRLTDLMHKLQGYAAAVPSGAVPALLQSTDRAWRLAAMARLFVYHDEGLLENLVHCLTSTEDTPFGQYWCLRAIEVTLRASNRRPMSESVAGNLQAFQSKLEPNSDRANILSSILYEFGSGSGNIA